MTCIRRRRRDRARDARVSEVDVEYTRPERRTRSKPRGKGANAESALVVRRRWRSALLRLVFVPNRPRAGVTIQGGKDPGAHRERAHARYMVRARRSPEHRRERKRAFARCFEAVRARTGARLWPFTAHA